MTDLIYLILDNPIVDFIVIGIIAAYVIVYVDHDRKRRRRVPMAPRGLPLSENCNQMRKPTYYDVKTNPLRLQPIKIAKFDYRPKPILPALSSQEIRALQQSKSCLTSKDPVGTCAHFYSIPGIDGLKECCWCGATQPAPKSCLTGQDGIGHVLNLPTHSLVNKIVQAHTTDLPEMPPIICSADCCPKPKSPAHRKLVKAKRKARHSTAKGDSTVQCNKIISPTPQRGQGHSKHPARRLISG